MKFFTFTTGNAHKPAMRPTLFIATLALFAGQLLAQPTVLGTQTVNGSYVTYDLNDLGAFKQMRIQATSSGAVSTRNWEFATGTAAVTNYSTNWRPYTTGQTLSGYNVFVDPATAPASARLNTGFGGQSGLMPAVTSGNYYTFNVTKNAAIDNKMGVLETSYNPTGITTVTQSPVAPGANNSVTVTITTAAAPASGENVFVRYSTDSYVTSALAQATFSGTTGTAIIPCQAAAANVSYYIYSSSKSLATINSEVTSFGQSVHDMSTLNLNNNGGANYTYTVGAATTNFAGAYSVPSSCYPTLASFITALNGGTVTGPVTCYVAAPTLR